MQRWSEDEGITLVEVMVTLFLLAIVLAAFIGTIIAGLRSLSDSRARQFASQLATESIENVRTLRPQFAVALDPGTVDVASLSDCTVAVDSDGDGSFLGFDPDGAGPISCEEIVHRSGGSITSIDPSPYFGTEEGVTYVTVPTYSQDGSVPSGTVRVTVELEYSLATDTHTIRRQALFSEVSRG